MSKVFRKLDLMMVECRVNRVGSTVGRKECVVANLRADRTELTRSLVLIG